MELHNQATAFSEFVAVIVRSILKLETARRLDQHVQAHHETESIFAPLVIDDRLKTMRLMRLGVYNKIVQNQ